MKWSGSGFELMGRAAVLPQPLQLLSCRKTGPKLMISTITRNERQPEDLSKAQSELFVEARRICKKVQEQALGSSGVAEGTMPKLETNAEAYPRLLDWLRYFCAFMLYMYGISKLLHLQFNMQSQLASHAVGSLTGYQLTWYYFGFSRVYASILGLTQVVGATLLLFRKTTLLGTLAMLPVIANILLINTFILVNDYGPYLISGLICTSLLFIMWHQRATLVFLLWSTQRGEPVSSLRIHRWIRLIIVLAATTIMVSGAILQHHVERSREQNRHRPTVETPN